MADYISESSMVNTCMKGLFDVIEKIDSSSREIKGIYHYTSTEVLDSLLTEATFWASNLYYLNDSSEYQTGIKFLEDIFTEEIRDDDEIEKQRLFCMECIREIRELDGYTWPGIFSISFSLEADVLNQWLTYAKEGGVCIEFEKEIMLGNGNHRDALVVEEIHDGKGILALRSGNIAKMIYDNRISGKRQFGVKDVITIVWNMLKDLYHIESDSLDEFVKYKKNIKFFFTLLASYVKNGNFVIEDEIRMLCPFLETLEKRTSAKIFYNKRENGILRPYIKVRFRQGEDLIMAEPRLPIKRIIVGPAGNQEAVFNSVVHRVEYGKPAVWKYGIEYLEKFLSNYIEEYLKRVPVKKNKEIKEAEECAKYIADEWRERCNNQYKLTCDIEIQNNRFVPRIRIEEAMECFKKDNASDNNDSILGEGRKRDIEYWKQENFLSRQGVWICKSEIPFVY